MNYYQAREMKDEDGKGNGLWHYTCRNDDRIWPVGYCADGCPGHDTEEGACEHQRQYEVDHAVEETYSRWTDCEVCGAPTKRGMGWGPGMRTGYAFCDAHFDGWPDFVRIGQVISS